MCESNSLIYQNAVFLAKKIASKKVLFAYFLTGIGKNIVIFEIIFEIKFRSKQALFRYFGAEIKKNLLSYLKPRPLNLLNS